MRYVILGTAGHIDHGKSCIVKALTGTDPDRLREEKERGITIDLGFADLSFEDDLRMGIVDVPGHERLVRNMLAGAAGIDMVLLVIAADEGIMPQSREHLAICNLLQIRSGVIALTKTDLVEPEWVDLVTDEVTEFVSGTFLEGAPIVPVSSRTGHGLEDLKEHIHQVALQTQPKPTQGLFRLPVDRVFTMKGFGTVVTGTAVSGSISVEDPVEILPLGRRSRVRGLQSHGHAARSVHAGQRCAVNLQGIEKEDLRRGDTLVSPGRFKPTLTLDVTIALLPDAPTLKSRAQVHFHLGTSETVARAVLYGKERIGPGENCYGQFRLQDPVVAQAGDRYIIRRFSPLETMGGGLVLDPIPSRRKRKDGLDDLTVFEQKSLGERIAMKIRKAGLAGMTRAAIEGWVRAEVPAVRDAVGALKGEKVLIKLDETYVHWEAFETFRQALTEMLETFHRGNPLKSGMPKEEARVRLRMDPKVFGGLVGSVDQVAVEKDLLRLRTFSTALSSEDKARILDVLARKGYHPPPREELARELGVTGRQLGDVLKLMEAEGEVVRVNEELTLARSAYEAIIQSLRVHYAAKADMTVAEFRDLLGTTRKYALPYLEYLDSHNVTLRVGDVRKFLLK